MIPFLGFLKTHVRWPLSPPLPQTVQTERRKVPVRFRLNLFLNDVSIDGDIKFIVNDDAFMLYTLKKKDRYHVYLCK
jgi:hypothetical protein